MGAAGLRHRADNESGGRLPAALLLAKHRWLESAIASTAGTDKGSARVAVETLTLSVAYDPKRTSLVNLQSALEKKIATRQLSLLAMRVIDGSEHR